MSVIIDTPLAEYASPEEHEEHARAAFLMADYHKFKAQAMRHRLAGRILKALPLEGRCDTLAKKIEALGADE